MSNPGDDREERGPADAKYIPVRIETSFVEEEAQPASLLRLANVILRRRRFVVIVPILLATVVCAYNLVRPRTWTATAAFVPSESEGSASRLAGLAAQFGFSLPGATAEESPEFYAELLRSGPVLRTAARSLYELPESMADSSGAEADLVAIFDIRGGTEERRTEKAARELQKRLSVRTAPESGMIDMSVRTRWPGLSVQIVERLLALVNEFNLGTRQSRAGKEREFVERRLEEAGQDLRVAEDSLQRFLQQNRRIENSSALRFEQERLQRRVSLRQDVFETLAQSLEQAKIEEVRNTPVITIVEPPYRPAIPDRRRLVAKGALSLVVGVFLGVVLAFLGELVAVARVREPERFAEFRKLRGDAMEDLRRIGRGFGARFRRGREEH